MCFHKTLSVRSSKKYSIVVAIFLQSVSVTFNHAQFRFRRFRIRNFVAKAAGLYGRRIVEKTMEIVVSAHHAQELSIAQKHSLESIKKRWIHKEVRLKNPSKPNFQLRVAAESELNRTLF